MGSGQGAEDRGDNYRSGCRRCGFGKGLFLSRRLYREHECLPEDADAEGQGAREVGDDNQNDRGRTVSAPPELFEGLRRRLRKDVVGHDEAVDRFALAGLKHVFGPGGQRLLLIGPTGVGKSTLCRALADALDLPFVAVDVSEMAETNWNGFNLSDALYTLRQRAEDEEEMRRAVVLLDEIDKVGIGDFQGTGREYRQGKQESLLGILGGGTDLHYGRKRDEPKWTWRSDEALVLAAGVFDGLPAGRPSPGNLVEWGLMEEFVGRLGSILRLEPLSAGELEEVLWRQLRDLGATYRAVGYRLVVHPSALEEVAELVASRAGGVDPRSGATLLRDAGERGLARMLARAAPPGSTFDLTTAELELPTDEPGGGRIGFR